MAKKKEKGKGNDVIVITLPKQILFALGIFVALVAILAFVAAINTQPYNEVGQKTAEWVKAFFASRGVPIDVKVLNVSKEWGLYKVNLLLQANGQTERVTYYVSPDGTTLFPVAVKMEPVQNQKTTAAPQNESVPKSEKPKVQLFVMSYCPFGLQMEKAMLPVLKLLGDKVDFSLHFVYYAMHGEKEVWENLRQYCIQREFGRKALENYLDCFTQTGSWKECVREAGINIQELNRCMDELSREYNIEGILSNPNTWYAGRFPPFPLDLNLNRQYGVQGSPTLVINGKVVNVQRSPEAVKEAICAAFVNPPPECEENLSTEVMPTGFGSAGTKTQAQCG